MSDDKQPIQLTSEALVPVAPTALAAPANVDPALWARIQKLPPKVVNAWRNQPRPTGEEMSALLQKVTPQQRQNLELLLARANPQKEGMEGGSDRFQPLMLRIYMGTGSDPMKPDKLPPGEMYGSDGRAVDAPLRVALIRMNPFSRTLWPARDDATAKKGPICSSPDGEKGSKYGACAECVYATKKSNEGGCGHEIIAWFITEDCTAIYQVVMAKTSLQAGQLLKKLAGGSVNIWDDVYELSTEKKVNGTNVWYVYKVARSARKNAAENKTDVSLHPIYQAFSRLVYHDTTIRSMLYAYDGKSENAPSGDPAASGETPDALKNLMGGTNNNTELPQTSNNPNFSDDA